MHLSEAEHKFKIRKYYWHVSEFEKEINNAFPNFRLFKSGFGWKLYCFMQRLKTSDQLLLANAQLKLRHLSVIGELGLKITEEEKRLAEACKEFILSPSIRELEITSKKMAGEKIRFATKSKLRRILVSKFIETYGSQCVHMETGANWDPQFHMRCCGWIINTQLVLARRQGVVWFRHLIQSEKRVPHPRCSELGTVPMMAFDSGAAWLESRWEDILIDEIEAVGDEIVKIAGFFFDAAPKLLEGLEFEKISELGTRQP